MRHGIEALNIIGNFVVILWNIVFINCDERKEDVEECKRRRYLLFRLMDYLGWS